MQFLIGLIIGIVVYITAYFIITGVKKKRSSKNKEQGVNSNDINSNSKGD